MPLEVAGLFTDRPLPEVVVTRVVALRKAEIER